MVKITKSERDYLEEKGFKFGSHIHRTYGHSKTYYATEDKKLLKVLDGFRKSKVLYSSN